MLTNKLKTHRRGTNLNMEGRFESTHYEDFHDGWDIEEEPKKIETTVFLENAKTIINKNDSPDIPFELSINPYRGCEHGCIYCYARPTHSYLNLSPGLDFESKIFAKINAPQLLKQELSKNSYQCKVIALGSATDVYQPVERDYGITRSLLEICLEFKQPVIIITKSSLILRDIDILEKMADENLVRVNISITTLNNNLAKFLEPRAATPNKRLSILKELNKSNIPTGIMTAPIIPGLNDPEIEEILKQSKLHGALWAGYTLIRLPYELKELFTNWLENNLPLEQKRILNLIRSTRKGKEYDSSINQRFIGSGTYAEMISSRAKIAKNRLNLNEYHIPLDTSNFQKRNSIPHPVLF